MIEAGRRLKQIGTWEYKYNSCQLPMGKTAKSLDSQGKAKVESSPPMHGPRGKDAGAPLGGYWS
eukprot:1640407-Pyramimonas_sp.AAC.1